MSDRVVVKCVHHHLTVPPPDQLMIKDGKLVTLEGKEVIFEGFEEGVHVNVVVRSRHLKILEYAECGIGWGWAS